MDKSKLRFPAALCFFAYTVINVRYITYIFEEISFIMTLDAVDKMLYKSYILQETAHVLGCVVPLFAALGLLIKKPKVSAVGILGIVYPVIVIARGYGSIGLWGGAAINVWLNIVYFVFFLAACFNRKNAVAWGAVAAVSKIVIVVLCAVEGESISFVIGEVLLLAGVLLLGMAFQTKKVPVKVAATATGTTATVALGTETAIEKLTKLKQLLDDGIITQEEFDAKKKQLLGL